MLAKVAGEAKASMYDDDASDDSESEDSDNDTDAVESKTNDWNEIAHDLWTDTQCLVDLDPLIRSPALDPSEHRSNEKRPKIRLPHIPFSDRIIHTYPKAEAGSVDRSASANSDGFVKGQQDRELLSAVEAGDENTVKRLIRSRMLIPEDGNTETAPKSASKIHLGFTGGGDQMLLQIAVNKGYEGIVKLLLDTVKMDVNAKTNDGWAPLRTAVWQKNECVVKLLLDTGKVDVNTALDCGSTPLHEAARTGCVGIVEMLVKNGAYVDSQEDTLQTPLLYAVERGHTDVVKILLEEGADANWLWWKEWTIISAWTPLWRAVEKGHADIVQMLLEKGADANLRDLSERTPLLHAVMKDHAKIVKILVDSGKADIRAVDKNGWSPLFWAVKNGSEAIVKMLLETKKVDIHMEDKISRTALSVAHESGNQAIIDMMNAYAHDKRPSHEASSSVK